MMNLRKELIVAIKKGDFIQVIYDKSLRERENINDLIDELVSMHNAGLFDIIEVFRTLQNTSDSGYHFFLTRRILEMALPHINAPVKKVMDCVFHLVNEAGQDMAAQMIFLPFTDFCAADPSRPKESIKQIESSIDQLADFLAPSIIAGSRIDTEHYLNEAIRLSEHDNIEIRKRAIFSLGEIQYPKDSNLCDRALVCLELSLSRESDDQLLGNLIKSAFSLYKENKSQLKRITEIINGALSHEEDCAMYVASKLFSMEFNDLPEALLDVLLIHLRNVKPHNKAALLEIDFGLIKLIKQKDPTKGIELLEAVLIASPNEVLLDIFNNVITELFEDIKLLNKLLTRWFLRGDRVLCESIGTVVEKARDNTLLLKIDPQEIDVKNMKHIIFVAKKTIGYLISKPVTAVSIIVSLMHYATHEETLHQLGRLIFDPLFINSPGKVKDFLIQQLKCKSGDVKKMIESVIASFDGYYDDLKSTGIITALHPSQTQRNAYRRYFSQRLSDSFKKAEKKSVFIQFVSKSCILYGTKSINYVHSSDGQSSRMEIPLQSHGAEVELPQYQIIDSFGLDFMLRVFRAEPIEP